MLMRIVGDPKGIIAATLALANAAAAKGMDLQQVEDGYIVVGCDQQGVKPYPVMAGEENCYGHPHEGVLQRIMDSGAAVLRTDELGTIEVVTDGQAVWWQAKDE